MRIVNRYLSLRWFSYHSNPYNDFLFNEIVRRETVPLEVFFIKNTLNSHPWQTNTSIKFKYSEMRYTFKIDWKTVSSALFESNLHYYIVAGWNNPTMFLLISILAIKNRHFAVWSDTPKLHTDRSFLKSKLRDFWLKWVFSSKRKATFLVTGKIGEENVAKMGINKNKIINFPFATDLTKFSLKKETGFIEGIVVFLSSGRLLNSHKGYDLAIKAFGILRSKGFNNFKYKIAGTGIDKNNLQNLIDELGLKNHIELIGWLEMDDLPNFYNSGNVFIHPSHFDPFPNAVLEAMACGLPVIGSNLAGSVVDRVVDGVNGFIHASGDVIDIADKILQVLSQPNDVISMGKSARKTSEQWQVSYNVDVIESLLY